MSAGAGWVGRRDVHGYCGASEESTIQRGGQCRRAGHTAHRARIVVYGMAVYGLSDSVKCQVSSARLDDVKSQTRGPGTMRHSKPPTSSEYSGLDSAPFSLPPHTRCMQNRMHAHTHSRTGTRTTHTNKYTIANRQRKVSPFPLEAGPGERASERATNLRVGERPRRMQRRGDSR